VKAMVAAYLKNRRTITIHLPDLETGVASMAAGEQKEQELQREDTKRNETLSMDD